MIENDQFQMSYQKFTVGILLTQFETYLVEFNHFPQVGV